MFEFFGIIHTKSYEHVFGTIGLFSNFQHDSPSTDLIGGHELYVYGVKVGLIRLGIEW